MNTRYTLCLAFLLLGIRLSGGDDSTATSRRQVEVNYQIGSISQAPTLDDYRHANTDVALFLSENVGFNTALYVVPTMNGCVLVWLAGDNPALTDEIRAKAEAIVKRNLWGKRSERTTKIEEALGPDKRVRSDQRCPVHGHK